MNTECVQRSRETTEGHCTSNFRIISWFLPSDFPFSSLWLFSISGVCLMISDTQRFWQWFLKHPGWSALCYLPETCASPLQKSKSFHLFFRIIIFLTQQKSKYPPVNMAVGYDYLYLQTYTAHINAFDILSVLKTFSVKCDEPTVFLLGYTSESLLYWKCNTHDLILCLSLTCA